MLYAPATLWPVWDRCALHVPGGPGPQVELREVNAAMLIVPKGQRALWTLANAGVDVCLDTLTAEKMVAFGDDGVLLPLSTHLQALCLGG